MVAVSHEYSESCRCFSCRGFRQAADEDLHRALDRMTSVDAPVEPIGEDAPVPAPLVPYRDPEPLTYRTPDPAPCPCCDRRERAEKEMQPFMAPGLSRPSIARSTTLPGSWASLAGSRTWSTRAVAASPTRRTP